MCLGVLGRKELFFELNVWTSVVELSRPPMLGTVLSEHGGSSPKGRLEV